MKATLTILATALLLVGCSLTELEDGIVSEDVDIQVEESSAPPSPSPKPSPSPEPTEEETPEVEENTSAPQPSPSPSEQQEDTSSASPRGDNAPVIAQGPVSRIVDGDTFELSDGTIVRIAIVNTPEVHNELQTCGPEASDFTAQFLTGETVAVYRPTNAPQQDQFNRTLGEVIRVSDASSLNVALVASGLGEIDTRFIDEDPDLASRLSEAESTADSPDCASQDEEEVTAKPSDSVHTGNVDAGYTCHPAYQECLPQVDDMNCSDIGHQVNLLDTSNDPYKLDRDGNLLGCESEAAWSAQSSYPYY